MAHIDVSHECQRNQAQAAAETTAKTTLEIMS